MQMIDAYLEVVCLQMKNFLQQADGVELAKFGGFLIAKLELSLKAIMIE